MTIHHIRRALCALFAIGVAVSAAAQTKSPYVGLEHGQVSSLSQADVDALLAGQGMGFAKAAELNGYPGPLHVIELAEPLSLTSQQLGDTRKLMEAHRARARTLGAELVSAERDLDRLFKERKAPAAAVSAASARVGGIQARLRAEHLNTHIAQTRLLAPEQVRRYAELRGYSNAPSGHGDGSHGHPKSTHHGKH